MVNWPAWRIKVGESSTTNMHVIREVVDQVELLKLSESCAFDAFDTNLGSRNLWLVCGASLPSKSTTPIQASAITINTQTKPTSCQHGLARVDESLVA